MNAAPDYIAEMALIEMSRLQRAAATLEKVQSMTRVQIPAYTDRWMMGDRYGVLIKTTKKVKPGVGDRRGWLPGYKPYTEIAHVKLDKSGKTVRVILDDCTVLT